MKKLLLLAHCSLLASATILSACGDDNDNPGSTGSGATGGTSTSKAGSSGGGSSNAGTTNGGTENGGTENGGTENGGTESGGTGGSSPTGCDVYAEKPREEVPADENGNVTTTTLTSDKIWTLTGQKYVAKDQVLTIEPCTLIEGSPKPNAGSIFVMRGGQIMAEGTADEPIVFTSQSHTLNAANPWGGLVLLGRAPIGPDAGSGLTPTRIFEGLSDIRATYGGGDAEDNSGSLAYVRLEYGGDIIIANREINGLTMAGVGSGTSIHHIMVKSTADDCFEWFGGRVSADHLVCQNSGDDMFDTDENYRGNLQFLFGRNLAEGSSGDPNGFEWDGNQPLTSASEENRSITQASNATLCGLNAPGTATSYGAVIRRNVAPGTAILNSIIVGFDHGVDMRDSVGTTDTPIVSWTNTFFDNRTNDSGNPGETDNDTAFDEVAWIANAAYANTVASVPGGFDCYASPPVPPTAEAAGETPGSGFDDSATYVGAFKDADDMWATGAWVNWD